MANPLINKRERKKIVFSAFVFTSSWISFGISTVRVTVENLGDDPDDEKTKALGSYSLMSPFLTSGYNIYCISC